MKILNTLRPGDYTTIAFGGRMHRVLIIDDPMTPGMQALKMMITPAFDNRASNAMDENTRRIDAIIKNTNLAILDANIKKTKRGPRVKDRAGKTEAKRARKEQLLRNGGRK